MGRISSEERAFLAKQLEKEGLEDRDYYIRRETLEGFPALGAPKHLMEVLLGGLRSMEAFEIRWEEEKKSKAA